MLFNSIFFIFGFLPVCILLYFLIPERLRSIFLVLVSVIFYAWGRPVNVIYLLVSMIFNYLSGMEIQEAKKLQRPLLLRGIVITSAGANIVFLAYFKYMAGALPLGISFYTFTVLSYLFDIYQDKAQAERNPVAYMLYVSFFPKITSGPIVQYADMKKQLYGLRPSAERLSAGIQLFLCGLMKKVLLADRLGAAYAVVTAGAHHSVLSAWLGMIFYSLQLYFDFGGYSDMAIGLAKIFGFDFEKNFDHPYMSANISEFWRRWHISLGNWFKQYVYFPMGGSRVESRRLFLNLAVVWLLTGIWHGNTWNFVLWGVYHGAFVILERFVIRTRLSFIPRILRILVTDLIVFVGWIFFFTPSLKGTAVYIAEMFGRGGMGFAGDGAGFYLKQYFVLLVISVIGATPVIRNAYRRCFFENRYQLDEGRLNLLNLAGTLLLLLVTIAFMVGSTYSTFLYFQF